MIAEIIVLGIIAIATTIAVLGCVYFAGTLKRKSKRQELDNLHAHKMQQLEEIKAELEIETLQNPPDEVYEVEEVKYE